MPSPVEEKPQPNAGDEPAQSVEAAPSEPLPIALPPLGDPVASRPIDVPSAEVPVVEMGAGASPPGFIRTFPQSIRDYFLGDDPSFGIALVPFCILAILLFSRWPTTNFIFDEQEALLANPFVRSVADAQPKFGWLDAFYRDFWGLGPERSIGSYRPIPNLIWRALWAIGARDQSPFLHHFVNLLFHGANGALACSLTFALTKRRGLAWIAGAAFTASAVLTEAVSGVVGIADVLGAMGALLALLALTWRLPWMILGVLLGMLFGLYSKESALCCVPLLPLAALVFPFPSAKWASPGAIRAVRVVTTFVLSAGAFVLYVTLRRKMFPAAIPSELSVEATAHKDLAGRTFAAILRWYAQPTLPKDPLNNPLVHADAAHRVAGALRVWFRGLGQVYFPWTLSGDYSAPQEPVPTSLVSPEILLGALTLVLPFPLFAFAVIHAWVRRRHRAATLGADSSSERVPDPLVLIAFGMVWAVVSYFPVSNIPVLLPTIRAERFWYFPVIGTSLIIAIVVGWLVDRFRQPGPQAKAPRVLVAAVLLFFGFQCIAARRHALDYNDDLTFWDATRKAVPRSAKAHLNYSVMKGARGDLQARLSANGRALELAPEWPMASIYYGDTLCRLHRAPEAWPHYKKGFELAPNDVNLVALAIQCLWDEKLLEPQSTTRAELEAMKDKYGGSWLEYLARDVFEHGEEHNGVDPKYRPRGYNEGPKD